MKRKLDVGYVKENSMMIKVKRLGIIVILLVGIGELRITLKYRKPNFTPVIFHNLSEYDSHLFIKNLGFSEGNIDCIPNNEEKYISFSKKMQVGSYIKKVEKEKLRRRKLS